MGVAELVQVRTTGTRKIQESERRRLAPELCAYLLHLPTLLPPGLYFLPVALALETLMKRIRHLLTTTCVTLRTQSQGAPAPCLPSRSPSVVRRQTHPSRTTDHDTQAP